MQLKLGFLGAAQNVTGSCHLLQADDTKILVDCGLYQERQYRKRNWEKFPVPPQEIDAVLLTHAHLDHCGLLPKMVRDGFKGKIFCTKATAEIAKIILLDAAKIQEEDAEHKRKRHKKKGRLGIPYPEVPLYTVDDAQACIPHFSTVKYKQPLQLAKNLSALFYDAGHVLGSAVIKLHAYKKKQKRTLLFSGDIGRPNRPIVCDPTVFEEADYVLIESTYGDRDHQPNQHVKQNIAHVINSTIKAGGNIVVPSFALERSQEILYYTNELMRGKKIEKLMIFLDSPMAAKITDVFRNNPQLFDEEMTEFVQTHQSIFDMPGLKVTRSADESKAINNIKASVMIIAGSGMCTGGRVKHHLVNNITRKQSSIMFVGYQAFGTLGRRIVDGDKEVRILGNVYPVKAKVERIHGFSAHADRNELLNWLKALKHPPRRVFVVHGETESALAFGNFVKKQTGWNVDIPEYQQEVALD